jgi:hypothetical protein
MSYLMDLLFGLLGAFVGLLVWALVKDWAKREWQTLTNRKSFSEAVKDLTKDLKRPLPPDFDQRLENVKQQVERVTRKRPCKPGNRYSVEEILKMARKQQRRQGP